MEISENNIFIPKNKEPSVQTNTTKDLSENLNEKGILRNFLEQYFHMIDNLENLDLLEKNMNAYEDTLKKLLTFSKTSFMEKTIWRVSDNGKFQEYCGAHLRNLLSPFKNMITLINDYFEGNLNKNLFKSFIEESKINLEENKKDFLDFCNFLEQIE